MLRLLVIFYPRTFSFMALHKTKQVQQLYMIMPTRLQSGQSSNDSFVTFMDKSKSRYHEITQLEFRYLGCNTLVHDMNEEQSGIADTGITNTGHSLRVLHKYSLDFSDTRLRCMGITDPKYTRRFWKTFSVAPGTCLRASRVPV